jgi:ABC-2 type transport system permease protein
VPGHSIDPVATAVLVLAAGAAVAAAGFAFERRDVASPLWRRAGARPETGVRRTIRLSAPWLRDAWLADLRSQWVSLVLWALGGAALMVMLVAVAKQVTTVWESSELLRRMFFKVPGSTFTDEYMAYVTTMAAIVPAAFVVAEASRWVGDISEGRAEALLAVSGSRRRIILEWAASALAGIIFVSAAVLAGCVAGAAIAGVDLRVEGLVRTLAAAILLGAAVCGVAILAVAVFRSGFAVGALGAVLGLGFMVTLFGPMFNLPGWVVRLSPFAAFGTPYASVPRPSGIALMAAMALVGTFAASLVAQRRGSVT